MAYNVDGPPHRIGIKVGIARSRQPEATARADAREGMAQIMQA